MPFHFKKIKTLLTKEKVDALLVINSEESGQPATQYISGFSGSSSVLLLSKQERFLITDSRYTERAKKESQDFEVIILKPAETVSAVLKNLIEKRHIKKILFDGSETFFSSVENIKKAIPQLEMVSRSRLLQGLRVVKDKQEVVLLKEAANIASRSFLKFLPEIKIGVSEKTLAATLDAICRKEGAEEMAFETIVACGVNTALPHSTPSNKKVVYGDLVMIDWGIRYKGYVSDTTRTVAVGKISPRLKQIYEAVLEAQLLGCKNVRAGIVAGDLDALCRNSLKKKGFEKYFIHATGHGIGLQIHELPVIAPLQTSILPVGAVITCEPALYIPTVGGVRIEDSLVITKDGNINLSENVPKELIII